MEENSGVLCINKPMGITSHGVINKIRKIYNIKRVGHTGTLDPMATGVLVVFVGRATKAVEYIVGDIKAYDVTFKLGITTDTGDITGSVLTQCETIPDEHDVINATKSFIGKIKQIPPMYSAIKIDGQKLVNLARCGVEIAREPRDVEIHDIKIKAQADEYHMSVVCSKGTYIRTLCTDIGDIFNCGAVMTSLTRTQNGRFNLDESYTIEEIENMNESDRIKILMPLEDLFDNLESVHLSDFYARLAKCGTEIYQKKIGTKYENDALVKLYHKNAFFALGRVTEYEKGSALRPEKQFIL